MAPLGTGLRKLALLSVLLTALVPLGPSLHSLVPHDFETSGCPHGNAVLHFESSPDHLHDSLCLVCAHLIGRHVAILSLDTLPSESGSIRTTLFLRGRAPSPLTLGLPETRAPPLPL